MADLLDQDDVDAIRAALRDVTDTFHRSTVTLRRVNGDEVDLLVGLKPAESGNEGEAHGELAARQDRTETVERWVVSVNRDYLAEKGLVDTEEEPARQLLISREDWVMINGKRFAIVELSDRALFRGVPVLVRMVLER